MDRNICVYCASSDYIAPVFVEAASELGKAIALNGDTLVYGGGNIGLMKVVAETVHTQGGKVVGIIPEIFDEKGLAYKDADKMIVTKDMRERKTLMEELSDAFITLPGGFGTLEELLEIITLKQIKFHQKPIVIVNIENLFDDLISLFEILIKEEFIKYKYRELYYVASDVKEAMSYIETYSLKPLPDKV